jgi:uncharacterized protein YjbI with pentapeptide repeats
MTAVDNWQLMCQGHVARAWENCDYTVLGLDPSPGYQPWGDQHTLTLVDLGNGNVAFQRMYDAWGNGNVVPVYASMRDDNHYQVQYQVPFSGGQWVTGVGGDERFQIVPTGDGFFALRALGRYVHIDPTPDPNAYNCNPLVGVDGDITSAARFSAVGQSQASILSIIIVSRNATGMSFRGVDLTGKTVGGHGVDLSHCDFRGVIGLKGASLAGSNLQGAVFDGLKLAGLGLAGADCTGADFTGADLTGFTLGSPPPTMTDATFTRAVIPAGNSWTGAQLHGAVLAGANLTGADLSGPTTDLSEANLSGAGVTTLTPDYQGTGIAGYDLGSAADHVFAYDYASTGHLDHLVCYRPGQGAIVIAQREAAGNYTHVYFQGGGGSGLGRFPLSDPADRIIAFDWIGNGKLDHLLCYRPGSGLVSIQTKAADGTFSEVFHSTTGFTGFPLTDSRDQIIAFDWSGDGKLDYLFCARPGTGLVTILARDSATTFSSVWSSTTGIGKWDLMSANDQLVAYDYTGTGSLDHLVVYRPGSGGITIVERRNDTFVSVYFQGDPGGGIADFPLTDPDDKIIAYDLAGTGHLDHLLCYRPGLGLVRILAKQADGTFVPVYVEPGGIANYDFAVSTDVAVAFDPTGTGTLGGLALCRPGQGTVWIVLREPPGPATLTGTRLDGTDLTGADLIGVDLREPASLEGATLTGAHLCGATMTDVNLTGANLAATDFTGCDLSTTTFSSPFTRSTDPNAPTVFAQCTLPYSVIGLDWSCLDLSAATITGLPTTLAGLRAHGLRRTHGDFTSFVLDGADFSSATLDHAVFTQAKLRTNDGTPASFAGARLMGTSFTGAVLKETLFTGATLGGTSDDDASADFSLAYLESCDFTGATLDGTLFSEATLLSGNVLSGTTSMYEAVFTNAYLAGADLTNANLTGANFDGAFMVGVVLHGADLTPSGGKPASLASAFLQGVDFSNVKLGGANLPNAVITNTRGSVQQQYYDENGQLTPMAVLRYAQAPFPAATSFTNATTCPNRRTYGTNTDAHLTIAQMMAITDPPTSWTPPKRLPTPQPHTAVGGGREGRPDRDGRPDRGTHPDRQPPARHGADGPLNRGGR